MKTLFALGALLAAAPAAAEPSSPGRQQIEAAAERCGLPARFLRTGKDAHGDFAEIWPDADGVLPDHKAFFCLLAWAQRTGTRIGFISEPPPGAAVPQPPARVHRSS